MGDSAETLRALCPCSSASRPQLAREIEESVADWWKVMEARAMNDGQPAQPAARLLGAVAALPDNCILTARLGHAANWYARDIKIRRGMMASLSGNLATMGPACPTPSPPSSRYPGPAGDRADRRRRHADERHQRLHHHRQVLEGWSDPRSIVLVLNNRDLNQVTWEQRVMDGRSQVQRLAGPPRLPLRAATPSRWASTGIRVDQPEQVGAAWDEALAADRPGRLEAVTDPDVPTLPPHITFKQAKAWVRRC